METMRKCCENSSRVGNIFSCSRKFGTRTRVERSATKLFNRRIWRGMIYLDRNCMEEIQDKDVMPLPILALKAKSYHVLCCADLVFFSMNVAMLEMLCCWTMALRTPVERIRSFRSSYSIGLSICQSLNEIIRAKTRRDLVRCIVPHLYDGSSVKVCRACHLP